MTELAERSTAVVRRPDPSQRRLRRRYAAERRFRLYGALAIGFATAVLGLLLATIVANGYSAFVRTEIALDISFDPAVLDPQGNRDAATLGAADYAQLIRQALLLRFPEVSERRDKRALAALVSMNGALDLRRRVLDDPALIGTRQRIWIAGSDDVDMLNKGQVPHDAPDASGRLSSKQTAWLDALAADGAVAKRFNSTLFTTADSREPEQAGVLGAVVGTFLTLVVTLAFALPFGVATAVYLEEFARKTKWTDLIEVNINNLAAVPSIVFGLLGLAVFLGFFGLPRSSPLAGGLVLALVVLPTIIIASRAALKSVPPSIRQGALAIGASPLQVVLHHVLPLAMPGILTGTIIGMAHALGETAPLLMIGMVAFIVDVPHGFTDAATVLPIQIFLWADSAERGFVEKTSAAILVLIVFLLLMNGLAIVLRRRFERRY